MALFITCSVAENSYRQSQRLALRDYITSRLRIISGLKVGMWAFCCEHKYFTVQNLKKGWFMCA